MKKRVLPAAQLMIFLCPLFFSALTVHGAQRQCSEIFLTPEQIQTYHELKSEIVPTTNIDEPGSLIINPMVPPEEQAFYFLESFSHKKISSLVELAQVLTVVSEMSAETASNIILQTESFAGFNQRTGLQGGVLEDYGKALFLNILRKDEFELRRFFHEQDGFRNSFGGNIRIVDQFGQLVNSHLKPQTRALTLMIQTLSPKELGKIATVLAAHHMEGASTKMEISKAIIETFYDIYERVISKKILGYKQVQSYFLSHVSALEAINRPADHEDLGITQADVELNKQMILVLESLKNQYPVSSNIPSLSFLRYLAESFEIIPLGPDIEIIPIRISIANYTDFFPYNKVQNVTQSRILPATDLYYYRMLIERVLNEIRDAERAKNHGKTSLPIRAMSTDFI